MHIKTAGISYEMNVKVYLDGVHVGNIKRVPAGYQYWPKGRKKGGEVYATLSLVQHSLES